MNKKFELLRQAVGCYKASHVSGDINEKALLEFIDELEQLTIPDVVWRSEQLSLCQCDKPSPDIMYGETCTECCLQIDPKD